MSKTGISRSIADLLEQKKSREVFSIDDSLTVLQAAQTLARHNVGALVVLRKSESGSEPMPVGIISERDIIRNLRSGFASLESTPVAEVMTKDVIIAVPEDSIDYAIGIMTRCRIRHLPVMLGKKLVGLVSIGDVVNAHISDKHFENRILREYIEGKYPG